jgi:hypothetical protein
MWLLLISAVLIIAVASLIVGNWLRKIGIEEVRANPYGSAASLAGQRKSGLGTWLNIAGAACVVAAVVLLWL